MTTKINRRTALLGTVTLPAAMAPLGLAQAAEPDPAVIAYREWIAAFRARDAAFSIRCEDEDEPESMRLADHEHECRRKVASTVATTAAGLAAQTRFAFAVFGMLRRGGRPCQRR